MIADEVAGGGDGAGEDGALADKAADQEKRRADFVAGKDFEQAFGGGVVGAVVIGKGDFAGVRAGDEDVAEELRLRPESGISSGTCGGGGKDGGGGKLD